VKIDDKIIDRQNDLLFNLLRLESYINTDKVIYKPNDVMFIEVLVLDAFNKTPIGLDPTDSFYQNLMF